MYFRSFAVFFAFNRRGFKSQEVGFILKSLGYAYITILVQILNFDGKKINKIDLPCEPRVLSVENELVGLDLHSVLRGEGHVSELPVLVRLKRGRFFSLHFLIGVYILPNLQKMIFFFPQEQRNFPFFPVYPSLPPYIRGFSSLIIIYFPNQPITHIFAPPPPLGEGQKKKYTPLFLL